MASLIIAAGIFTYDRVKNTRQKRRARKAAADERFSELEKDNADRMARLQNSSHPQQAETVGRREGGREHGLQRVQSGLGDWNDDRVLRRGSGGSLRRRRSYESFRRASEEEESPPPGYEETVRGR